MSKVRAHTNIALIKYWGKADEILRIPMMSSISMTLDSYYTDTKFELTDDDSQFLLNGKKIADSTRVFNYIHTLQDKFGVSGNFIITSDNHVPTSAGLASSSSAFAALAAAFAGEYKLNLNKRELSRLARLGSGSATRSIYGGFVEWEKGSNDESSYAQIIDEHPTMDLKLLAVELKQTPKKISSTKGMELATTSPLYRPWLRRNNKEIFEMKTAIRQHDFTKLGSLAELSANEMHAINLTAMPEFTYFEPETISLIKLVEQLRQEGIECYYTIDAGPNVKILTQLRNSKVIQTKVQDLLPNVNIIELGFGSGIEYLD